MTQPFLALITPLGSGGGPVDPGYNPPGVGPGLPGGPPPQVWPGPRPSHPIMLPGMPGWGGGGPVDPGYSPPWAQVRPPVDPGYSPPWAQVPGGVPQPPLGIWGPTDPRPTPPIYIPPEGSQPPLGIWGPPQMPPGFWGGGMGPGVKPQPHPEHPIVIPPDLPPTTPEGGKIEWKTAWTPQTGWIVIGIPAEGTLVPTPSSG